MKRRRRREQTAWWRRWCGSVWINLHHQPFVNVNLRDGHIRPNCNFSGAEKLSMETIHELPHVAGLPQGQRPVFTHSNSSRCPIRNFHLVLREGIHFIHGTRRVKVFGNAIVYLYDQAYAEAHDNATVHALCRSRVKLFNQATCHATDNACVMAFHRSLVEAGEWTQIKLFHRSVAELFGHASAKAHHRSRLAMHCWSTVELKDKARIEYDFREGLPDPAFFLPLPPRRPRRV